MKKKTWISRELDTAGIKAQYDGHVKRIYYPLVYNKLFSIDFFKIKESQDKNI